MEKRPPFFQSLIQKIGQRTGSSSKKDPSSDEAYVEMLQSFDPVTHSQVDQGALDGIRETYRKDVHEEKRY